MENQNEIIAQFMGIEKCDRCVDDCGQYKFGPGNYCKPSQMQYSSSWDWIMPAWHKFRDTSHITIKDSADKQRFYEYIESLESWVAQASAPDTVFNVLVQAITWFNSLTQNK